MVPPVRGALVATLVTVPVLVVKPSGFVLLYGVNPNASVTLSDVNEREPPNVKLPDVVTEPVSVNPLTVPVPETDVTVPVFVVNPSGFVLSYGVKPKASVTFKLVKDSVPPSVREPESVTVPVKVKPLTLPVPDTEVTVPKFPVKLSGLVLL